ncbi:MAG: pilin [Candidatus Saccharibacteria bacterium]|nr:pilin [Candidatus Saccharibacteria bacterium]
MKNAARILLGMLMMTGVMNLLVPAEAGAAGSGGGETFDDTLLGMRAWYYGLEKDENGGVKGPDDKDGISKFVFKIVMNILYDLELIIGLLATGFVIFGGYQIMTSSGDVGAMAKGKKTITRAVIGLVIAVMAQAITAFISDSLTFS